MSAGMQNHVSREVLTTRYTILGSPVHSCTYLILVSYIILFIPPDGKFLQPPIDQILTLDSSNTV